MYSHITGVVQYIIESFLHTWPYLLITIPIAVAVKMSGASKYINRVFTTRPLVAIFLATLIGAFSPLCSSSVIPVIAALLMGGVPLAPVMSFWIASPSMDAEIFFLSVSTLGWDLAAWRMGATLLISLSGGLITLLLVQHGWLGSLILREQNSSRIRSFSDSLKSSFQHALARFYLVVSPKTNTRVITSGGAIALPQDLTIPIDVSNCSCRNCTEPNNTYCDTNQLGFDTAEDGNGIQFLRRLATESLAATVMAVKFMLLAWFIGALFNRYIPETWIMTFLGEDTPWAIISAALMGIPVYTSNLTAMPLIGGLVKQGLNPGAALAFLIAGPTTTLPAMSAVWGIVNRKVFAFYVVYSLLGAIVAGYIYLISY